MTFGPPIVNGKAAAQASPKAIYREGVPGYADTVAEDGSLVITVGNPVEGRDKRRVTLIEAEKSLLQPFHSVSTKRVEESVKELA